MRNFIDIVSEMTIADGFWKNPSYKELAELTRKHDLRGVACMGDVYLAVAHDIVHFQMRSSLGLPHDEFGDPHFGFNFYTVVSGTEYEHDDYEGDDLWLGGRDDWLPGGEATFSVDGIAVFASVSAKVALTNRAFARMVTPRASAQPLREFLDSEAQLTPYADGDLHGYTFHLDDREFFVGFKDEGDGEFYSSFTGADEKGRQTANLLNHNKPFRVFSAIVGAFRKFISDHEPNMIWFDVDDAETRRVVTYDRMLEMLERQGALPEGYVWDRDSNNRYMIFKDGYR